MALVVKDGNYFEVDEISAPATPASGKARIYVGTDGKLHIIDDTGSNTTLGSAVALDDLSDVTITTPSEDQFVRRSGSSWINETVTIPTNLDSLSDVTITTPSNNEILKYNGSAWVNGAAPGVFPTLVGCRATINTSSFVCTANTTTLIEWNGENFDYTSAFHDNSTSPELFTIPSGQTGYYVLGYHLEGSGAGGIAANQVEIEMYHFSTPTETVIHRNIALDTGAGNLSATYAYAANTIFSATAGDTFYVGVINTNATNNFEVWADGYSWFYIYRVA